LRKRLLTILTISVTVILLVLVLSEVGVEKLLSTLGGADPVYLLLAFLWAQLLILPGVYKVQALLAAQNHRLSFWYLFKLFHVGSFFNNFLPSNVGGDVVRTYEIGKVTGDPAGSLAAVFVERVSGFIVLVAFAVIALLTHLWVAENALLVAALAAGIFGLIGVVWMVIDVRVLNLVERLSPKPLQKYIVKFGKFQKALLSFRGKPAALRSAAVWSILFNGGAIVYVWLTAQAFHQPINLLDMAFIVPLTMVIAMIPISFNGIGLQEWSYVLLFPLIGVPDSVGLSAMLTIRVITLFAALLGGLFYLQMNLRRDTERVTAQQRRTGDALVERSFDHASTTDAP